MQVKLLLADTARGYAGTTVQLLQPMVNLYSISRQLQLLPCTATCLLVKRQAVSQRFTAYFNQLSGAAVLGPILAQSTTGMKAFQPLH